MANSVDELKALVNTKLGFARPNRFLVTLPSFGGGGLLGIFTDEATKNKFSHLATFIKCPHGRISIVLDNLKRLFTKIQD